MFTIIVTAAMTYALLQAIDAWNRRPDTSGKTENCVEYMNTIKLNEGGINMFATLGVIVGVTAYFITKVQT